MGHHKSRESVRGTSGGVGHEVDALDVDRILRDAEREREHGGTNRAQDFKRAHNGARHHRHYQPQPPSRLKIEDPDKPFVEKPLSLVPNRTPLAATHKTVAVPSTSVRSNATIQEYFDYFAKFKNNLRQAYEQNKAEIAATVRNMLVHRKDASSLAYVAGTVCSKIFNATGDKEFSDLAVSCFRLAYSNGYKKDKFIGFYITFLEQRGLKGEADDVRHNRNPARTAAQREIELP